jgi:G3E family GTPase
VTSVTVRVPGELDGDLLRSFAERTAEEFGADLLRWKGIVAIAGESRKVALQGVHQLFEIYPIEPWGDRHRDSRVVFIGTNLERETLEKGLTACKVPELASSGGCHG